MTPLKARTYEPKDPSKPWQYPHHPECDDPHCEDENVMCWQHAEDVCLACGSVGTVDGETACPDCNGTGAEPV